MTECINSLMKPPFCSLRLLEPAFEAYKKDINCMMTIYILPKHESTMDFIILVMKKYLVLIYFLKNATGKIIFQWKTYSHVLSSNNQTRYVIGASLVYMDGSCFAMTHIKCISMEANQSSTESKANMLCTNAGNHIHM